MLFLVCPLWRPIDDETGRPPLAQSKEETNETLYFFLPFFLFVFFSAQIALSQIVVFVYRACERKRKIRAVERRAAASGGAKKRADTK